jgi:hypothetical protein
LEREQFIGRVPLTAEDIGRLGELIRQKLRGDWSTTVLVAQQTPLCLAFFLVFTGIFDYEEGNYWSGVERRLQIELEPTWKSFWGQSFLSVLRRQGIDMPVIKDSLRYVTPILLQGGIPINCLENFLHRVLLPLIKRNIVESQEVHQEINLFRQREKRRQEAAAEIVRLKKKQFSINRKLKSIKKLQVLKEEIECTEKSLGLVSFDPGLDSKLLQEYYGLINQWDYLTNQINYWQSAIEKERNNLNELQSQQIKLCSAYEQTDALQNSFADLHKQKERLKDEHDQERYLLEQCLSLAGLVWGQDVDLQELMSINLLDIGQIREALQRYKFCRLEYGRCLLELSLALAILSYTNRNMAQHVFTCQQLLETEMAAVGFKPSVLVHHVLTKQSKVVQAVQLTPQQRLRKSWQNYQQCQGQLQAAKNQLGQALSPFPLPVKETVFLTDSWIDVLEELNIKCQQAHLQQQAIQSLSCHIAETEAQLKGKVMDLLKEFSLLPGKDYLQSLMQLKEHLTHELENLAGQQEQAALGYLRRQIIATFYHIQQKMLEEELLIITERLKIMGEGDVQAGLELLEEYIHLEQQLEHLRQQRDQLSSALGLESSCLEEQIVFWEKNLEEGHQLLVKYQRLMKQPGIFTGLDEPVARFLLYGGEWAQAWIMESINLVIACQRIEHANETKSAMLPTWARKHLQELIEQLNEDFFSESHKEQTTSSITKEYSRAPYLELNLLEGNLEMIFSRQTYHVEGDVLPGIATLIISGGDENTLMYKHTIRLYKSLDQAGWLETRPLAIPITKVHPYYRVRIFIENILQREWIVETSIKFYPALVFNETGLLLAKTELPRSRLWLLLLYGTTLCTEIPILAEESMPQIGPGGIMFLIDPVNSSASEIILMDNEGHHYTLTFKEVPQVKLSGGQIKPGIWINGDPLYVKLPEGITLPMTGTEPEDWELGIRSLNSGYENVHLSEIEFTRKANDVYIPLFSLFNEEPHGWYRIRLRGPGWSEYVISLAVFPELDWEYEETLYWPEMATDETTGLTFMAPMDCRFTPFPPAFLRQVEDDVHEIAFSSSADSLQGELSDSYTQLPVTLEIPRVKWRLHKLEDREEWSSQIGEYWLSDWIGAQRISLQVYVPLSIAKCVILQIDGVPQGRPVPLKDYHAEFDLLPWFDSLSQGAATKKIGIMVYNQRRQAIGEGLLFTVHCQWEVQDLQISEKEDGTLLLGWKEKRPATDRVANIWQLDQAWLPPKEFPIPDGQFELEISGDDMSGGYYRLLFTLEDPWDVEPVKQFPSEQLGNCLDCTFTGKTPVLLGLYQDSSNEEQNLIGWLSHPDEVQRVRIILLGRQSGKVIYRVHKFGCKHGEINFNEFYSKHQSIKNDQLSDDQYFHWIGIWPVHREATLNFYLLPGAAPVENLYSPTTFPYDLPPELLSFVVAGMIDERYPIVLQLPGHFNDTILKALKHDQECRLTLPKEHQLIIKGRGGVIDLKVAHAVVCSQPGCPRQGEFCHDLDYWLNNHHSCSCLAVVSDVDAHLFWTLKSNDLARMYSEKFQLNNPLLPLIHQFTAEEWKQLQINGPPAWERIAEILWEREKTMVATVWGGKNE